MTHFCGNFTKEIFAFTEITVNCAEKNFREQEMKTMSKYEKTIYYM